MNEYGFSAVDLTELPRQIQEALVKTSTINRLSFAVDEAKANVDKYKKLENDRLLDASEAQRHANVFVVCLLLANYLAEHDEALDDFLAWIAKGTLDV